MPISSEQWSIRQAVRADVPTIFQLIHALADYEKLSHEVVGSEAALDQHLFGPHAFVDVFLAEADDTAVGFALFFTTYSTYRTAPGLYLEDLFVLPNYRRQGIGKALFVRLAQYALERNYPFLSWSVLDWNTPAIAFYERIGAIVNHSHRICRLTDEPLQALAQQSLAGSTLQPKTPDITITPVVDNTVIPLFQLIQSSAAFHGAPDQVVGTIPNLRTHLFAQLPVIEALTVQQKGTVGIATFSQTYSTFLTQPGIYLEDLFVATDKRRQGIGSALMAQIAKLTVDRQCGRLEWLVQTWNENAIAFYEKNGATILPDWRRCELAGEALQILAKG